jgi:hypothetical protein
VALAIRTGIPPSVWADEGPRAIATAFELIEESNRPADQAGVIASG